MKPGKTRRQWQLEHGILMTYRDQRDLLCSMLEGDAVALRAGKTYLYLKTGGTRWKSRRFVVEIALRSALASAFGEFSQPLRVACRDLGIPVPVSPVYQSSSLTSVNKQTSIVTGVKGSQITP
jgi:hypothetical protein